MAVPKQRQNQSRRDKRRGNIFIKAPNLVSCPKCQKPVLPHSACGYKGREVIDVMAKLEKKEQKRRKKEIESSSQEKK
jgi:ribosomal protein L32